MDVLEDNSLVSGVKNPLILFEFNKLVQDQILTEFQQSRRNIEALSRFPLEFTARDYSEPLNEVELMRAYIEKLNSIRIHEPLGPPDEAAADLAELGHEKLTLNLKNCFINVLDHLRQRDSERAATLGSRGERGTQTQELEPHKHVQKNLLLKLNQSDALIEKMKEQNYALKSEICEQQEKLAELEDKFSVLNQKYKENLKQLDFTERQNQSRIEEVKSTAVNAFNIISKIRERLSVDVMNADPHTSAYIQHFISQLNLPEEFEDELRFVDHLNRNPSVRNMPTSNQEFLPDKNIYNSFICKPRIPKSAGFVCVKNYQLTNGRVISGNNLIYGGNAIQLFTAGGIFGDNLKNVP